MKQILTWSARHTVFANLLMVIMLIIGVIAVFQIRSELLPQFALDQVSVKVEWEGASPAEVEEGVCIKIEEALTGVEGVNKITSIAYEGRCEIAVELHTWTKSSRDLMEDIRSEIDRIRTLPEDIERPIVSEVKRVLQVVDISLFGGVPEEVLKRKATEIKDELLEMPSISKVVLGGLRDWEISIEVSEEMLRRYGLTFERVGNIIRKNVLELSGGDIRSEERRIRIRTLGKRYTGLEFERLEILTQQDGTILRLGDIARVVDAFEDSDRTGRFDGKPAALITVYRTDEEDALSISKAAIEYVKKKRERLPEGLDLVHWADTSRLIQDRLDLLMRNGRTGLVLVFLSMWLFLNIRLSFWVAMGIPVSLLTALGFLNFSGGTLNMLSMFAFIMVLGILVDDAIVVAENIYSHMERGKNRVQAAIDGCHEVVLPVIATVVTSIVAFAPLLMVEGTIGKFMAVLPAAIIAALIASLIESLFILPAHLGHWVRPPKTGGRPARMRNAIDRAINWLIHQFYAPILRFCLSARYLVISLALVVFMVTVGLAVGGHVRFLFFPKLDSDWVEARILFPPGTPIRQTQNAAHRIEQAAVALDEVFRSKTGEPIVKHIFTTLGEQFGQNRESVAGGSHMAHLIVELLPSESRGISGEEITNRWREITGVIPDVLSLTFGSGRAGPPGGKPIDVQFYGDNIETLRSIATELKRELTKYPGIYDIQDDFRPGKLEFRASLKPQARVLGVSLDDLGRQLRARFFGLQVLRLQRGRDDVKVRLRYPPEERRSIEDIRKMRVRTSSGAEIPFHEVAEVQMVQGLDEIRRVSRARAINVTAEMNQDRANPTEVLNDLNANFFPQLLNRYNGVGIRFEGQAKETQESFASLFRAFALAIAVIFAILATLFRSYFQPLIVMSAIPFGVVGAIWGHIILGYDISILSMFGILALTGVVVNDSLVLLDFANRSIKDGMPIEDALHQAGVARWRAIVLTTMTTAAGLGPILFEKSFQAQFLIPMAISLCFGLLFATVITLVLVPVISLIGNDVGRFWWRIWTGRWLTREEVDVHSPQRGEMGV
ncbi:MAG: efflux RND transporter permease subunit [Nitrospinae bacterium]|nr:efflux RND transporter permease subunit [Nitrospinota bacterium]